VTHGTVLGLLNCRLEGNQNLVYGRVQIHTIKQGLINEEVTVTVKGKNHRINIVEEVKDIVITEIQEVVKRRCEDEKVGDYDMQVDEGEGDEKGETNSEGEESSDEEEDGGQKVRGEAFWESTAAFGGRNGEGSRFSWETRVVDSF
ncbi:hypothetical protein Tco_1033551, partial [Tanacetum coccineum]